MAPSEKIGSIHKVRRYFYHYLDLGVDQLPMLDKDAVNKTFEETAQTYEGASLLIEIKVSAGVAIVFYTMFLRPH